MSTLFYAGDTINQRYQIEDVARGQMGIVYLCIDILTNKYVALKTFKPELLISEEVAKRFINEARTWLQLDSHINIIRAYGLKYFNTQPHLVLERVIPNNIRGTTLKDYIFTHAYDFKDMLQIAIGICDGMVHAVRKFPNFVHRDLKPENILIGDDLIPKISDFGMTLEHGYLMDDYDDNDPLHDSSHPVHLARRMLGTPATASPEQCMCEPLDTRSDIYSFGCVLYQIATKRLPFYAGKDEEYIVAHLNEDAVPPVQFNNQVTNIFSEIILKCLSKDREDRFYSFQNLREELISHYKETFFETPYSTDDETSFSADECIDRCESLARMGEFELARDELDKAEAKEGKTSFLLFGYGCLAFHQKKYHDAISSFRQVIKDKPNIDAYEWLADSYNCLHRRSDAIHVLENACILNPAQNNIYIKLAEWLRGEGDSHTAAKILHQGLFNCADTKILYKKLIDIYHSNRDRQNEFKELNQALEDYPEDVDFNLRLAEYYQQKNDKRNCSNSVKKAAILTFTEANHWYRLGALYAGLNQLEDAVDAWQQALMNGRGDPKFLAEFAEINYRLGHYKKAWDLVLNAEQLGEAVEAIKRKIQSKVAFPS